MNKVIKDLIEKIGQTPLVRLNGVSRETGAEIIGKLEAYNPGGSIKDRAAYYMVKDAEEKGMLKKGSTIIEATSGNTGIALALICAVKGYKLIITMPDTMSIERRNLLKAYGAEVILTPGRDGMNGSIKKAEEVHANNPGSIIAGQFYNPHNPEAHYLSTGPEIWEDSCGKVDILVSAVGTGGTISGTGKYLKEKNPEIKIVAVEPAASPLLSGGEAGPHSIQGIGANFIPETLDRDIYEEVICCKDEEALSTMKALPKSDGILCGISSGAALWAALELGKRLENKGKNIVVILPDTGERYLSVL